MEAMAGTLFFYGKCGMCTRSRNFLLKLNRTGDLLTEPLQTPGTAERLGHFRRQPDGRGALAGCNRQCVRGLGGRQRRGVRGARDESSPADLPHPGYPVTGRRGVPLGRRSSLPLPGHHPVLRVASGLLLTCRRAPWPL